MVRKSCNKTDTINMRTKSMKSKICTYETVTFYLNTICNSIIKTDNIYFYLLIISVTLLIKCGHCMEISTINRKFKRSVSCFITRVV